MKCKQRSITDGPCDRPQGHPSLCCLSASTLDGIREGVVAMLRGDIKPWDEVKKELGLDDDNA